MNATDTVERADYELCFQSVSGAGRGYAFPCDAKGGVDMDHLSDNARNDYLYARALMGRYLLEPSVQRRHA
jgi:hypothetical protein